MDKEPYELNAQDSAYPVVCDSTIESFGLTKREYFAGLAMQGFIINPPEFTANKIKNAIEKYDIGATEAFEYEDKYLSMLAIKKADDLLKELDKWLKNMKLYYLIWCQEF